MDNIVEFDMYKFSGGHDGGQKLRVLCALVKYAFNGNVIKNTYYESMLKNILEYVKLNASFIILIKFCKSKNAYIFNDELQKLECINELGGVGLGTPTRYDAVVKLITEILKPAKYELLDPITGSHDKEITTFTTIKMYFTNDNYKNICNIYNSHGSSLMNIIQSRFIVLEEGEFIFKNVLIKSIQKINGINCELAASLEWTKLFLETFFGASVNYEISNKKKIIKNVKVIFPKSAQLYIPSNDELNDISKLFTKYLFDGTDELSKELIVETLLPFLIVNYEITKEHFLYTFEKPLDLFNSKHVVDSEKTFTNIYMQSLDTNFLVKSCAKS